LFDPESDADCNILRLAKGEWATYMRIKLALVEAEQRLGIDFDDEHLRRPVEHVRDKRHALAAYLQDGGRLNDAPDFLGWPWVDIARIVTNGVPGPLIAWSEETADDFEDEVREGASIRSLDRSYGLGYNVTRTLVKMFRDII
jgi:hypothetical protein